VYFDELTNSRNYDKIVIESEGTAMLIGIIQFIIWLVLMVFFVIGLVCVLLTDPITMRKEARKKVEEKRKSLDKCKKVW
jgi:hypothetical protein